MSGWGRLSGELTGPLALKRWIKFAQPGRNVRSLCEAALLQQEMPNAALRQFSELVAAHARAGDGGHYSLSTLFALKGFEPTPDSRRGQRCPFGWACDHHPGHCRNEWLSALAQKHERFC